MRAPQKISGQSKWANEFNAMVDVVRSLMPARSDGVLTSRTTDGVRRSAPRFQSITPAKIKVLEIIEVIPDTTWVLCQPPGGGTNYLIEAPPTFGAAPERGSHYNTSLNWPDSRFVNPTGQLSETVKIKRIQAHVRQLELEKTPDLAESSINVDRSLNQIWWPTYSAGALLVVFQVRAQHTLEVETLFNEATAPGDDLLRLNQLGVKSAITGFWDLNVDGRRWTNYREVVSDAVVHLPPFKQVLTIGGEEHTVQMNSRDVPVWDNPPTGYDAKFFADHIPSS